MSLVDTEWLENNIEIVKIIDCSWHMPQTQRNGFEEYTEAVSYTHLTLPTILLV